MNWIVERFMRFIWGPDPKEDPWMTLDWSEEDEDDLA